MKQIIKRIHRFTCLFVTLCLFFLIGCKDTEIQVAPGLGNTVNQTIEEINSNINAYQKLIAANVDNVSVKSCVQMSSSSYRIELEDGNSYTMLTFISTLGEKEGPVYSPEISAIKDGDVYYWALDGDYLMSGGKKVAVIDGNIPVIGISNDGFWTVTCGGDIQTLEYKAEGGTIKSLFGEIDLTDKKEIKFLLRGETPCLYLKKLQDESHEDIPPTNALRRPISPDHPAWFVHIDVWNTPDPQAIIDLIPEDIRPYVIFNISLSVDHDEETGRWRRVEYGYETAKSWLRTCAENNVWAMVQPSSGGFSHFPDYATYDEIESESSIYYEFYRDYPNFVGFNYCEQFWGFDDKFSVSYPQRLQHWTNLMQLSHKYGGYLTISFCGSGEWSSGLAPMAMLKRDPNMAAICKQYPENLIVCEKFTTTSGFFDIESACLGTWLSGYAGQYGMRFDVCGWPDDKVWNGDAGFQTPAGAIPMIEHIMLTGQTVYDGPELIWTEDFKEVSEQSSGDGYTQRRWERYPQFDNISMDIYRKIIDGTIRIMSREEVINRTKFIVINDVTPTGGTFDPGYLTPATLFEGLYRLDEDGNQNNNIIYFKKTGRYPTIPMAMDLADDLADKFIYKISASQYNAGWEDIKLKQGKFNRVFPEEYTGNLYAGRHENGWVVYNPLADVSSAFIPFKYNTCDKMELDFAKYTTSVIKEYANKLKFYVTNYSTKGTQVTDVIRIFGSNQEPTYNYVNRVAGNSCSISKEWNAEDKVFTLTLKHNGAVDIDINCSGNATERETFYTESSVSRPISPREYWGKDYAGPLQYEAEHFEYKNGPRIYKSAGLETVRLQNYTGLGYLNLGTNSSAAVRDYFNVNEEGVYNLIIKYSSSAANVNNIGVYINGREIAKPEFTLTGSGDNTWQTVSIPVTLNKGKNKFELKALSTLNSDFYLDNIVVDRLN